MRRASRFFVLGKKEGSGRIWSGTEACYTFFRSAEAVGCRVNIPPGEAFMAEEHRA